MSPEPDRDPVLQVLLEEFRAFRIEINGRIDKLVTQEAFAAEQRRVDERLASLGQDVVDEREARVLAIKSEQEKRVAATSAGRLAQEAAQAAAEKINSRIKWLATGVAVPIILVIAQHYWGA